MEFIASHDDQTIIAQCTPQGSGALALLRMCGINAFPIAASISRLAGNKKITELSSHTVHFGRIIDGNDATIDQCMFILMRGPKTFTGQDTVEITCHNNPFIIATIIEQAIKHGARLAQHGEFSRRSVLNNKMDLSQAEAINELIHANTQSALKKSLAQLDGSFSSTIADLEKKLIKALAFCESSFEFIDEEMEFGNEIATMIEQALDSIATIKKNFDAQNHIRQGIRISIIGSVNAGKSSLFNALLNKNRAIVTEIPGTTRDVIEAGLYKNDTYWTLIDTAGLRQTDDRIEHEGIQRSLQEAHQSDIILLVLDNSREITQQELTVYQDIIAQYPNKIISVYNKIDAQELCTFKAPNALYVSSKENKNLARLEQTIEEKITMLLHHADAPFLLNKRQHQILTRLEAKLHEIQTMLTGSIQYELLSYHLNDALADLSELTGKTISEQAMDAVFREFCVGK